MRETRFRFGKTITGLLGALLMLSSCFGATRTPEPGATRPRPEKNVAGIVQPGVGGNVGLNSGAEVAVPPDALTAGTLVNLRALDDAPPVPIPLSLMGRAYEMVLEGGALSGTAILSLPYPSEINPADYQLDVYRWTGRTWEETGGREAEGMVRAGIAEPGTFAVLGRWRMAEAEVRASMPRVEPGRQTAQVLLAGEYRFEAPPRLVGDYIEGRLELKLDTSGGAGYSTGTPDLDQTISQNALHFRPDAAATSGLVNFSYTFEVSPGDLNIPLGSTGSLYSVLTVSDSAAPTRRLSSAVEYVQTVPIQVVGTDIVRPRLQATVEALLRWQVMLNGEPLFTRPGLEPTLSLAEALARGGLGDYKILIEAEQDGTYVPVSNEVTVRLASPSPATPTPQLIAGGARTPTPTSRVNPFGTMPPTPTRRINPQTLPTDTPTPPAEIPTPAPTATPTRPPEASIFWSDSYNLRTGDCTTVHWTIENVREVYYNERPATGREDRQECPAGTTNYVLRVVYESGREETKRFTITVQGVAQGGGIEFWADKNEIVRGSSTIIHWKTSGVSAVYFQGAGVNGEGQREVRPEQDTEYVLRVVAPSGETITNRLVIHVVAPNSILIAFWSERYTMERGQCTTLHWSVEGVERVYLRTPSGESGVPGIGERRQVCPDGQETYTVRVEASGGRTASRDVYVRGGPPDLVAGEVVAQAIVKDVAWAADLDGNPANGEVAGWNIHLDGINALYTGGGNCCEIAGRFQISQTLWANVQQQLGLFDWPLAPHQLVEFRARGTANLFIFDTSRPLYFKRRS